MYYRPGYCFSNDDVHWQSSAHSHYFFARRAHLTKTNVARAAVNVEASFFPRMNDRQKARPRSSVAIGGHSFGQYWALALAAAAFCWDCGSAKPKMVTFLVIILVCIISCLSLSFSFFRHLQVAARRRTAVRQRADVGKDSQQQGQRPAGLGSVRTG